MHWSEVAGWVGQGGAFLGTKRYVINSLLKILYMPFEIL